MRLFARFWPFGRPQSNPPPVGPQFHPLESNRNPSKMYWMFGAPFSHIPVYQCFPFSPLYLMFCGAYRVGVYWLLEYQRIGIYRDAKRYAPLICTKPNLAGVPDALIFFWFFSSIKRRKKIMWPYLTSYWDLLFFPWGKKRSKRNSSPLPRARKFCQIHSYKLDA